MGLSSTWIRKDSISWIAGQYGYDHPQTDWRNLTGATHPALATCGPSSGSTNFLVKNCKASQLFEDRKGRPGLQNYLFHSHSCV